jgi:hypothetical protein
VQGRVARWYICKPKTQLWYILESLEMENVGLFYEQMEILKVFLLDCIAVWHILCSSGIFLTILVCCTKKNLATLAAKRCAQCINVCHLHGLFGACFFIMHRTRCKH